MPDPRATRGLPERWLLPPAPRDPEQAARWEAASFERRRELARVGAADLPTLSADDTEVVAALARARLATSWRALAGAPVLGWLVLMTVWGFGRSTYPATEERFLVAGLLLGVGAWIWAAIRVAGRLRRARGTLAAIEAGGPADGS